MKSFNSRRLFAGLIVFVWTYPCFAGAQVPITYQGQLKLDGVPVTQRCDFSFTFWDALEKGNPVGSEMVQSGVPVRNGLFSVQLNVRAGTFRGEPIWLEVAVECPGANSATLQPRQLVTPAPMAMFALDSPGGGGTLSLPFAGTNTSDDVAFALTNSGAASGIAVLNDDPDNVQPALFVGHGANGPGLFAQVGGSAPAVWALSGAGGGHAGLFQVQGGTSTEEALKVDNNARGPAARFITLNDANTQPTVEISTGSNNVAASVTTLTDPQFNNSNATLEVTNEALGGAARFENTRTDNNSELVSATSFGTGHAGAFRLNNTTGDTDALFAWTNGGGNSLYARNFGSGGAGLFEVGINSNDSDVLTATTVGGGSAGHFEIDRTANNSTVLEAVTNGTGGAGYFQNDNVASTASILVGEAWGSGPAVLGDARGAGDGVMGYAQDGGRGVYGLSDGGGPGVHAKGNGAGTASPALRVESTNTASGIAMYATNDSANPNVVMRNSGSGDLMRGRGSSGGIVYSVDNNGDVAGRSFQYNSPKVHKLALGPADFTTAHSAIPHAIVEGEGVRLTGTSVGGAEPFFFLKAPVHLPHDAIVTNVVFYYSDNSDTIDVFFDLQYVDLSSASITSMASGSSTGTPGHAAVGDSSILNGQIDNNNRAYHVRAASIVCGGGTCVWPSNIYVHGAVITYTTTEAD